MCSRRTRSPRESGDARTSSAVYVRPTNIVDVTTNYFFPGVLGGDHALKAGFRWRTANGFHEGHFGGNTIARFSNGVAAGAQLYRDAPQDYMLYTYAAYLKDTFTRDRFTFNIGLRWDRQRDKLREAAGPGHRFAPQWLPAVTFDGADSGVRYTDWSPRLGMNYDLFGNGKSISSIGTTPSTSAATTTLRGRLRHLRPPVPCPVRDASPSPGSRSAGSRMRRMPTRSAPSWRRGSSASACGWRGRRGKDER